MGLNCVFFACCGIECVLDDLRSGVLLHAIVDMVRDFFFFML